MNADGRMSAEAAVTPGFVYNDGGRAAAGFKGSADDCVTRAIAIATGIPYKEVYDLINLLAGRERTGKRKKKISNARTGVFKENYRQILESWGWRWTPTMTIGSGCRVHLVAEELPKGVIIAKVSRHLCAVKDGVIHDTHDPRRFTPAIINGIDTVLRRCVYGYFSKA